MAEKKGTKTMLEVGFVSKLSETLKSLDDTSRNALAVEAKIRPATINELASGKSKQFNFETLAAILEALNRISEEKGYIKKFNVNDVFEYDPDKKETTRD
ncbi:helix-turn-helix domain-containing protein [Schinkia azotoformans]|uniref:helix-turn-helix domain-containing protein n=1 Tax=Schinkia azotoformans TaxID=1454 RepID=UPI002DBDF888|nr:helix-turn-helix domain-containing protein [Schinkia azotoformans]MEC1772313.1 XRE family transcriptional regulator [Schinkia azotoformans]MED4367052.1 XRE family transcriptional regulator [Schinkia azotoformans]